MSESELEVNENVLEKNQEPYKNIVSDRTQLALKIFICACVLYMFFYSYKCFCANQTINEGFIEKTIKTGTESDLSFDVDAEVKKLSDLQEKYLVQLDKQPVACD